VGATSGAIVVLPPPTPRYYTLFRRFVNQLCAKLG
jgi:hypothetical protein